MTTIYLIWSEDMVGMKRGVDIVVDSSRPGRVLLILVR